MVREVLFHLLFRFHAQCRTSDKTRPTDEQNVISTAHENIFAEKSLEHGEFFEGLNAFTSFNDLN